jgi:hypothetical protein
MSWGGICEQKPEIPWERIIQPLLKKSFKDSEELGERGKEIKKAFWAYLISFSLFTSK